MTKDLKLIGPRPAVATLTEQFLDRWPEKPEAVAR